MAWQERIRSGKYQAPSGAVIAFEFADVRQEIDKKTTAFTFSNVAGAFVQDKGLGATTFPMRIFISGADYDLQAKQFVALLSEPGAGKLTHPFYGLRTVVPIQIRQRDDLVTGAGQAIFDVPFIETLTELFPRGLVDRKADSLAAIANFDADSPASFASGLVLETSSETANFKTFIGTTTDAMNTILGPLAGLNDEVKREFDAAIQGLTTGLDALVDDPIQLAQEINNTIRIPIAATNSLQNAFTTFSRFLSGQQQTTPTTVDSTGANEYISRRLTNYSSQASLVEFTVNEAAYRSRQDAIIGANSLDDELTALVTWDDTERASLDVLNTGKIYQPIQEATALERGRLVAETFDLPLERRFFIDRTRNIVDLAVDLYGNDSDETVNLLIETNGFVGPDLLQIFAGREVVFFR